ncbi:MAG TPA: ribonuclease Z [Candidatus Binatia bacterium]|nr:ribonuclease Z [Candidatus Binatia bacterium]
MADRFAPRLINGPFEDPGLFIGFHYERRAMLFDLGRLDRLSVREILKLSDVFVSHTHIDHFIGFDHLLRFSLNRQQELRLYGPKGFIDNIRGKLAGYTWNLIRDYPVQLVVHEIDDVSMRKVELKAAHGFRLEGETIAPFSGTLLEEPALCVRAAILDHKIPCLAFGLEESTRFNVKPDVLQAMGLNSGPWLDELKTMLRENRPPETRLQIPLNSGGKKELTLQEWRDLLIVESRGQKIVYVVDNQYNESNAGRILSVAQNADLFYCEASFSQAEEAIAKERFHLTATQAGLLARRAKVTRLIPFHFSPRYQSEPERLKEEALRAFAGSNNSEGVTTENA